MSAPAVLRHELGANRGTHWTVAGSVAVIIFGSYLIYNNRARVPAAATIPAAERNLIPVTPGPRTSQK
jgi:hypothetical protein